MALSFLSQNSGLLDLQSIFDPQFSTLLQHQHHQQQQEKQQQSHNQQQPQLEADQEQQQHQAILPRITTKVDFNIFNDLVDQMEYNNNLHRNHNQYQSNNNNNISNNNSIHTQQQNNQVGQNRHFISGYHHQHIGSDYEQVINFVDSPPNSEESWTDGQSKDSPGPQIIDVQTIYSSSSGSRKRRMDWDSLETAELPNKVTQTEKEKQKREKHSGRSSWSDDIGFDLSAEFNSNSYLNNESFLSFSPSLTALKQEPQTDQVKINAKISLDSEKRDKSSIPPPSHVGDASSKNELNTGKVCNGCGSPQGSPATPEFELNAKASSSSSSTAAEKSNAAINGTSGNDNYQPPRAGIQQLTVVDAAKIETGTGAAALTTTTTAPQPEEHKFQYILAAATSIATKNNEETLTYLNQGQSYEIKLKKIGDLSFYRDKILKSVIKICFHERRLQFMEREQMKQWQASRPGERIIEVDVPLSYGLCHVSQPLNSQSLNTVELFWDPLKEVGAYIKVNCISTEFTPKKHGGEKGVPFRLQIETYIENSNTNNSNGNTTNTNNNTSNNNNAPTSPGNAGNGNANPNPNAGNAASSSGNSNSASMTTTLNGKQAVHAAACQIKVFKLKGADRKHKQDREKIQKRPQSEQEKFQPSYECTIMNDILMEMITPTPTTTSAGCYSPEYMKLWPNSPVHIPKYDGMLPFVSASPAASSSPIAINNVTSTNSPTLKLMDVTNMVSPPHIPADIDDYNQNIMPESTPAQVAQWLTNHRLTAYLTTFACFSGADVMRMSKEDLIQICGLADGIRMNNILRAKAIAPRLTLYVSLDGSSYNAIYLLSNAAKELQQKLFKLPGFYEFTAKAAATAATGNGALENGVFNNWGMHSKYSGSGSNIFNDVNKSNVYISGPSGVHVTITDEVLNNEIKDGSLYVLDMQAGKVILKVINKQDN